MNSPTVRAWAETTAADRERQQRGEREGGDASPHSGHGSAFATLWPTTVE